ncbi:MAG TPA: DNA transfer protein p32 [Bdellovibrionota bacterium]|jgi:hypothetical protein|nr:DNA transfer protein p32 [Bdellovibrionota bacterium]
MSFVAAAIAGGVSAVGSAVGGAIQADAASNAAKGQAAAAEQANAVEKDLYNEQKTNWQPYMTAGTSALSQMQNPSFQQGFQWDPANDPGYQFRMQQGQQALERASAAKGAMQSGGFAKALSRYNQDYASNEYGNAFNRFQQDRSNRFGMLGTLAGYGQNAASNIGAAAQNYGANYSNNVTGAANAQGAAQIAGANAISGAIGGIGNAASGFLGQVSNNNWMDQWGASHDRSVGGTTKAGGYYPVP